MLELRTVAAAPRGRTLTGTGPAPTVEIVRDFEDPYLELLRLLREAAEIEHALMVQYLYATFSVRPEYPGVRGSFFASSNDLLGVAIQEMRHLDDVSRLLVEVGGAPCLVRQDFPYEADLYPFPFHLERLGPQSLAKYTWTEAPASALDRDQPAEPAAQAFLDRLYAVLGDDVRPNHLGSIYATMIGVLQELAARPPRRLPDVPTWVARLTAIQEQGESDHFRFFREVFMGTHRGFPQDQDVWALDPGDPRYPSLPVPTNPVADDHGEAWLGDLHYWIILILLDLSYRHQLPLSALAKRHMVSPLWALGLDLAAKGQGLPFDPLSMGYAPGVDRAGSLEVLRHLVAEADALTQDLVASGALPEGYPAGVNGATSEQLSRLEGT